MAKAERPEGTLQWLRRRLMARMPASQKAQQAAAAPIGRKGRSRRVVSF